MSNGTRGSFRSLRSLVGEDRLAGVIPKFNFVTRPDGTLLTPGSLPAADTQRWVIRRKADVVMAVQGGLITVEEACARYRLANEEFYAWQRAFERFGMDGLRIRRTWKPQGMTSTAAPADNSIAAAIRPPT